ncbi:hypothetical protein DCAR_0519036 [Daucus carota subsp. sativus]|uniref:Uncharacterized protein n=1 Tax=Daucus carota subsp. sativus TaxID=79200 RepID=A0A161ZYJ5_DAUCS|nr:hypothetical protein DCAR_0519036 [Daucus carota subsp. sativus]
MMIGPIEELLDRDIGLGVDHPDFIDVVLLDEAQDPVKFDVAFGLADQVHGLGLGQVAAQENMANASGNMHNGTMENQVAGNGVPK